jgi:hypothetical protein
MRENAHGKARDFSSALTVAGCFDHLRRKGLTAIAP